MKQDLYALVIDDEPQVSSFIAEVLGSDGWIVSQASSADQAFELFGEKNWSLVFCDVMLGESDGYAVMGRFLKLESDARFILMTGHGSAAGALDATAFGANDYLVKPFTIEDILGFAKIAREQNEHHKQSKSQSLKDVSTDYISDIPLIGKSPKFIECLKLVGRVAATKLPVLITGESGTGKEIVAQSVHRRSSRAKHPFITVNCGALTETLIESELFGHSRGAFTGADRERIGLWEEADGGTIFLDEITETSLMFQVKLLRALQQGEIRRVGSNRTVKVDVRVIAATNRNIEEEVKQGRFRQDLMYRLNVVTIHLPTLRERVEDIPLLAKYFAQEMSLTGLQPRSFSAAAIKILKNYEWQGNIRELENVVLHAASLSNGIIYPEHLPLRLQNSVFETTAPQATTENITEWVSLAEMETRYVSQVLAYTGGNKQAAARILNIDRKTLARIIKREDEV